MKLVLATITIALLAAGCRSSELDSSQALVERYRKAHQQSDVDSFLQLVCWDHAAEDCEEMLRFSAESDFENRVLSVAITPRKPDQLAEYMLDGTRYVTNLDVVGNLEVKMRTDEGVECTTTYPVGIQEGRYLIATAMPAD